MNKEKTTRPKPCLCICCPICGAVFMACSLSKEYYRDYYDMEELINSIIQYAREGYSVSFKDAGEFTIQYCEHL